MRRRAALLAATLAPVLALALCAGWTAPAAAGDGADRRSITHGGAQRSYVVRAPSHPPAGAALPLVLVLHGGGTRRADDPGAAWSATDAIWAFFRAQRKQGRFPADLRLLR